MPFYKAPDQSVHQVETEFAHVLPAGSVEITEEEAASLLPTPTGPTPAQQIEKLERETLLPRPVRDFMLLSMEQAAVQQGLTQGMTAAQSIAVLRAKNSGYRRVKELDEQIAALRAPL